MNIHCPQCDYERHVADDKLPASACMATCPKCGNRFNFRECTAPECAVNPSAPVCSAPQEQPDVAPTSPVTPVSSKIPATPPAETAPDTATPKPVTPQAPEEKTPTKSEQSVDSQNMWDDLSSTVNRWDSKQNTRNGQANNPQDTQRHRSNEHEADEAIIPWENPAGYTLLQGLVLTIKLAAMAPASFFGKMIGKMPLSRPLTFFVILGVFQAVIERLWYATLANTITSGVSDPQLQQLFASVSHDTNVFVTLLVTPFILTLQVFIISGLYYLMFRFVRPDKADFKTLFRVMCYAAAPTVVCVVPVVGPLLASLVYLVWTIIGCKHALNLPWSRVFMAVAPLYVLAIAMILQVAHTLITSIAG